MESEKCLKDDLQDCKILLEGYNKKNPLYADNKRLQNEKELLQAERDQLKKELEELKLRQNSLAIEKYSLIKQTSEAAEKSVAMEKENEQLKLEGINIAEKLSAALKDNKELSDKLAESLSSREKLFSEKSQSGNQYQNCEKAKINCETINKTLTDRNSVLEKEKDTHENKYKECESLLKIERDQITKLKTAIKESTNNAEKLKSQENECANNLNKCAHEKISFQQAEGSLKNKLENCESEIKNQNEIIKKLENSLTEKELNCEKEKGNLRTAIEANTKDSITCQNLYKDLLIKFNDKSNKCNEEINLLNKTIKKVTISNNKLNAQDEEKKKKFINKQKSCDEKILNNETQLKEYSHKLNKCNENLLIKIEELNQYKSIKDDIVLKLEDAHKKLSNLRAENDKLRKEKSENTPLADSLQKLEKCKKSNNIACKDLQTNLAALETEALTLRKEVASLNNLNQQKENLLKTCNEKYENQVQMLENKQSIIKNNETNLSVLKRQIVTQQVELENCKRKEEEIFSLQTSLKQCDSSTKHLQEEITKQNTELKLIQNILNQCNKEKNDIVIHQNGIEKIKTECDDKLNLCKQTLDNLTKRENEINNLKIQYNSINEKLKTMEKTNTDLQALIKEKNIIINSCEKEIIGFKTVQSHIELQSCKEKVSRLQKEAQLLVNPAAQIYDLSFIKDKLSFYLKNKSNCQNLQPIANSVTDLCGKVPPKYLTGRFMHNPEYINNN